MVEQAYYRWREEYGLQVDQAGRLRRSSAGVPEALADFMVMKGVPDHIRSKDSRPSDTELVALTWQTSISNSCRFTCGVLVCGITSETPRPKRAASRSAPFFCGAQEPLRQANSRIALDVYTRAISATKREANNLVMEMVFEAGRKQLSAPSSAPSLDGC